MCLKTVRGQALFVRLCSQIVLVAHLVCLRVWILDGTVQLRRVIREQCVGRRSINRIMAAYIHRDDLLILNQQFQCDAI